MNELDNNAGNAGNAGKGGSGAEDGGIGRLGDNGAAKPAGGYFARHWRGQLPLPLSFWVNGVLVFWIGAIVAVRVLDAPWPIYLLGVVLVPWQVVGIWRSAHRYSLENVASFWGTIAKAVLILLFLGPFIVAFTMLSWVFACLSGAC